MLVIEKGIVGDDLRYKNPLVNNKYKSMHFFSMRKYKFTVRMVEAI